MSVKLPELSSWLSVVVIGFAVVLLLSNPIGWAIMAGGFALGMVYFALDLRRKF